MSVIIYQPTKNPMQSGKGNIKKWLLEHELENSRYTYKVTGWTGNTDTKRQIRLKFDSEEEAIAYARRKGLEYSVIEPNKPTIKIQSYSDTLM